MQAMRARAAVTALAVAIFALAPLAVAHAAAAGAGMVRIAGGDYRPLYRQPVYGTNRDTLLRRVVPVRVAAFDLDRRPVTNREYLAFVAAHPEWRRSRVSRLYAEKGYLGRWRGDLDPGPAAPLESPVVEVPWFAARAYLSAQGKRLPTVAE